MGISWFTPCGCFGCPAGELIVYFCFSKTIHAGFEGAFFEGVFAI
jgi:hypothetical protein